MADRRAAIARANGRKGGRPRLFANGTRAVSCSIPEDDVRLIELVALRTGQSLSQVMAGWLYAGLSREGLAPTWGVPDAERASGSRPLNAGGETGSAHPRPAPPEPPRPTEPTMDLLVREWTTP